ncbi:MAG TPA: hypothetical protein EYP67_06135 [Methanosarcinales archaeon]|nr:hypothetical protein [Methanosarcinales archaeon]
MHTSRAQNASIIALLEPASAVVFAAIIMSQQITSSVLVGGGMVRLWCAEGRGGAGRWGLGHE